MALFLSPSNDRSLASPVPHPRVVRPSITTIGIRFSGVATIIIVIQENRRVVVVIIAGRR